MDDERAVRIIDTSRLDPESRELIREVGQGCIRVILEDSGEPVAELVAVGSLADWEADRREFFEIFERAASQSDLSPREADELALEVDRDTRARPIE